jgi:hypothetical protein
MQGDAPVPRAPRAPEEPNAQASSAGPQSIGAYLAAQRRLRGISAEELSRQTRIPLRSLERLEAGSFDEDVDGFVRGFVRTVAEALGLDPDETVNRTLHEPGHGSRSARAPRLSLRRVAATVLGIGLVLALAFGVRFVARAMAAGASSDREPISFRHDPVRALAEAQGITALQPAPALALASARSRADERGEATASKGVGQPVASPASP